MLTKKDFKAVAEIITENTNEINNDNYCHYYFVPRNRLVMELANYFATQNPYFDRERFMQACGLED